MTPRELRFSAYGRALAALGWGTPGGPPVLALHGWLDNAASFNALAPLLPEVDLVALDLAGHGLSDHRSPDAGYNIWRDVGEIEQVLDQLGWESATLIGHSRGAIIATLMAATLPARVRRLIALDFLLPEPSDPRDFPRQLATAIADARKYSSHRSRGYDSLDSAIAARMQGPHGLGRAAAQALVRRGIEQRGDRFYWRVDPRLYGASEVQMTAAHGDAVIAALNCPLMLVVGADTTVIDHGQLARQLRGVAGATIRQVPGGHFFHLQESPRETAELVRTVLASGQ